MLVCAAGLNKDYPYTYVNGVLRDGDGDEIKLLDPRNGSSAARTSAIASPRIRTPVPRKRSSENVTPAFLKRNLRLGSTMSPIPRKRKITDARRQRRRRNLSFGTAYRFPVRSRFTIARTNRLKRQLSEVYHSILFEEERRLGTHNTATTRTMNRMKEMNAFTMNAISLHCAYTVAFTGHFISSDVLMYGLELWCPRQHIPFHWLGSAQRHTYCFDAVGQHENAAQQVALMQRKCLRYKDVIESGLCLVLPYNYPVQVHWMCVLAWKDTSTNPAVYVLQPRNSFRAYRVHDNRCVRDAKTFLKGLYEYAGTPAQELPKWTEIATPDNVCEQAAGEMSCCLHTLAQAILAFNGSWRSQSFSEEFVHSIRLHLLDDMSSGGIRVHAGTPPNPTMAVGRFHGMNLKRKYFQQVLRMEKTKECRLRHPSYRKYQIGDVIRFRCGKQRVDRQVVAIRPYDDLEFMLKKETVKACLPHLNEVDVKKGVSEYMSFFKQKDLHLGMLVFHLSPLMSRQPIPEKKFTTQKPRSASGQVRKKTDLFNR